MRRNPLAHPEPLIRRVYAFVAYRIGEGADAEDVTSEVFERALRYQDSFDARKGDVLGWLMGIARRRVAEIKGQPQMLPQDELPERGHDPELAERTAGRLELADALRTLSVREQELIALRYGADLTARQIGDVLEMQPNAVEVALHRALERLRRLLSGEGDVRKDPSKRVVEKEVGSLEEEAGSAREGETGDVQTFEDSSTGDGEARSAAARD